MTGVMPMGAMVDGLLLLQLWCVCNIVITFLLDFRRFLYGEMCRGLGPGSPGMYRKDKIKNEPYLAIVIHVHTHTHTSCNSDQLSSQTNTLWKLSRLLFLAIFWFVFASWESFDCAAAHIPYLSSEWMYVCVSVYAIYVTVYSVFIRFNAVKSQDKQITFYISHNSHNHSHCTANKTKTHKFTKRMRTKFRTRR